MKRILLYIGIVLTIIGCAKDDLTNNALSDGKISFSAGVATRVSATDDCAWAEDGSDKVGIFTNQADDTQNIKFLVAQNGVMTSDSKVYPLSGDNTRTYYAYHPYMEDNVTGFDKANKTISIDHTKSAPNIPLLWSSVEDSNEANVKFGFVHKLVKVVFNLTAGGADISDLADVTAVTLKGANAKAGFLIEDGVFANDVETGDIPLTIENGGIIAYLIPMTSVAGNVTLDIIAGDKTFTTPIITASWNGGEEYKYNVTVGEEIFDIELRNNIYYINSAEGLKAFADIVNGYENTTAVTKGEITFSATPNPSINGKLTKDIDLGGIDEIGTGIEGKEWTPIGVVSNSAANYYSGTFDGGGFEVSGLYINTDRFMTCGLFGYVKKNGDNTPEIKNLGVSGSINSYSSGVSYSAGIASYIGNGSITQCYNDCSVSALGSCGGITASNESSSITKCCNFGDITANLSVGGIAGQISNNGTISGCYNSGAIKSNNVAGGIIGNNTSSDAIIKSCYSVGSVSRNKETNTSKIYSAGGIIGLYALLDKTNITYCYYDSSDGVIDDGVDKNNYVCPKCAIGFNNGTAVDDSENNYEGLATDDMKGSDSKLFKKLEESAPDIWEVRNERDYPVLKWQKVINE